MSRFLSWCIRDKETGRIVLVQAPNAPILVFLATYVLRWFTGERLDSQLINVGMGALIVWGLDELFRGVNPLRRLLGVTVLGWEIFQLFAS